MAASLYSFIYALALLGCLVTWVHSLANDNNVEDHHKKHAALFVFGDSLFDPGNNNYINTTTDAQANFPPYGESFFKYPTGRFCDGRILPDFIGGGRTPETSMEPLSVHHFRHPNRNDRLPYFKNVAEKLKGKLGDEESNKLLSTAVYMISIGNNDYISLFSPLSNNSALFNSYTHEQYVDMVIGNFTTAIQDGGRKFVIFSTIPLGCIPLTRALNFRETNSSGCFKELQDLAKMHNKALLQRLSKLEKTLQGFKYSYFDFYTAMTNIIHHPSRYGFKEAETACCGSGPYRGLPSCGGKRGQLKEYELCKDVGDYLFFDHAHPTEKSNLHFGMV